MKKQDLIKELEKLPDDAEIVIVRGDEILGDYIYQTEISLVENVGLQDPRGIINTTYSNYASKSDKKVIVWEIT